LAAEEVGVLDGRGQIVANGISAHFGKVNYEIIEIFKCFGLGVSMFWDRTQQHSPVRSPFIVRLLCIDGGC
jgi:hypothetical protein